jgi:uncharacterized phage protein (TIGR02220 family)
MPRIRTIKPEFFLSDDILDLSPLARLLYIGLWCHADKEGRLKNQRSLKTQIIPEEQNKYPALLQELVSNNHVHIYAVDGNEFLYLPTFRRHQRPHHTEKESIIPPYGSELTVKQPLFNGRKGKEGKGKEGKGIMSISPRIDANVSKVIDRLNAKAGTSFRNVESHAKLIRARIGEGYTVEDLLSVIDSKTSEWVGDEKMERYLRPETLFSQKKFSTYIGQANVIPLKKKDTSSWVDDVATNKPMFGDDVLEGDCERI